MSALQKMLGLDGVDFAAIGESVQQGIASYNSKLDTIIANQSAIIASQQRLLALLTPELPQLLPTAASPRFTHHSEDAI